MNKGQVSGNHFEPSNDRFVGGNCHYLSAIFSRTKAATGPLAPRELRGSDMAARKQDNFWKYGLIALVGFLAGRGSVDQPMVVETPVATEASPAALYEAPTTPTVPAAEPTMPPVLAPAPRPIFSPVREEEPSEEPVYFANCSAARAVGAAPVYIGDPGYASHLDRDHDGVGCE